MKHKKIKATNRRKTAFLGNSISEYLEILRESKIEDEIIKKYKICYSSISSYLHSIPRASSHNEKIEKVVGYFDLSIISYVVLYGYLSDEFMVGKIVIGNTKYDAKYNLSFLILLRAIIYDLIVLRNLTLVGFDSQYHSISRNFIEKSKIFCLCFYDTDFFEHFTKYRECSDEILYKNYTKGSKLDNRINAIANIHRKNLYLKSSMAVTLDSETIKDRVVSMGHPFVHMNNYMQILGYFVEETESGANRINLNILNSSPKKFHDHQYALIAELSILIFLSLQDITNSTIEDINILFKTLTQVYYSSYIDYFYHKHKP
jgi:hypothetical protein